MRKVLGKTYSLIFLGMFFGVFLLACTEQKSQENSVTETARPFQSFSSNISDRAISANEFVITLYPLLTQNCASCHSSSAATPFPPFIADADSNLAFNELYNNGKVDLIQPENSRVVAKLQFEQHQCWTANCAADALSLQTSIQDWAALINIGQGGYVQLCSSCHGLEGQGTSGIVGLTQPIALTDLMSTIEARMPISDPSQCVGLCATDIAQYIFENFNAANSKLVSNPLAGLPEGNEQLGLLCTHLQTSGINNLVRDAFCNGTPPTIQSLTDLQAVLGLSFVSPDATGRRQNGRHGNPSFTLLGHSSSLVARFVSAINPRALIFTPPVRVNGNRVANPGFVAMGFVRGDQFAEIVASDPVTNELTFFLLTFEKTCNLSNNCTPGDLLTPAVESNWVNYTLYSQADLQNTILDCLQCHQTGGPGTGSILRMQELRNPWSHFFRNNRPGGRALLSDFVAAHGVNEDYAGIPAQLIDASDPAKLEDLVRGNGFNQPHEFRSNRIEAQVVNSSPAQPLNNDIPGISSAWQRLYNQTVLGHSIPVPYHDIKVTDSAKLASLTASYRAFVDGTLAAVDLPDIRDVFLDAKLPDIGFRVMAGLDGEQIITQACSQCHNTLLNQSISRAKFNVEFANMSDTQGGVLSASMRDIELGLAIARLNLPVEDVRKMPPEQFKTLSATEILAATSYLCSQMSIRNAQCTNVPAFVSTPAVLPDTGGGTGGFGGFFGGFFW